jgi:hypothetical protein
MKRSTKKRKTTNKWRIKLSDLKASPPRTELALAQIEEAKCQWDTFGVYCRHCSTCEAWIEGFMRDMYPDRELKGWTHFAKYFDLARAHNPEADPQTIYDALLQVKIANTPIHIIDDKGQVIGVGKFVGKAVAE